MKSAISYVGLAFLSCLAAALTYACGMWSGHLVDLRSWDDICAGKPVDPAYPNGASSWVPLSNVCRWSDGTSRQLVPPYVNPLTLALLVIAALCLVLAVRATVRNKTTT